MEEAEDFTSLSVSERLAHKNWKARVSAYEELGKEFRIADEGSGVYRTYSSDPDALRRAVLDANAVAQEKALDCVLAFVEGAGHDGAVRTQDAVVGALVDKCLGAPRAATKTKATELCLVYVECSDAADGVTACLIDGLKAKQPKTVAACVACLKELVRQFGARTVDVKPVLKTIPTVFAHTDKNVRAEGVALAQELWRWLGPALEVHLAALKPVQLKELTESFAKMDAEGQGKGSGVQTRFTRAQQRQRAIADAESTLAGKTDGVEEPGVTADAAETFDAFDLAEPVAILSKLPNGFYEMLSSSKWKERKEEALDPLLALLAQAPRLRTEDDYGELVRALTGRMTDANVACVTVAAGCLAALARGLRADFARFHASIVPPVLERLKEKKQSVVDALADALDATFAASGLAEVLEDVSPFIAHKNPQVKSETMRWLARCLRTTKLAPTPADTKTLSQALVPMLSDSAEPVRAAAAESLGTLMKVVGERPLAAALDGLDELRRTHVREQFDKAEVLCRTVALPAKAAPSAALPKPGPSTVGVPARPRAAPVKAAPTASTKRHAGTSASPVKPAATVSTSVPSRLTLQIQPPRLAAQPPAPRAAAVVKLAALAPAPVTTAKTAPVEPLKFKMSQDDADATAEGALPPGVYSDLGDANWKTRLAATESLRGWIPTASGVEAELIVRALSKKPGWRESNFQVYAGVVAALQVMLETSSTFTKACIALSAPPLSDKLGDIKLKKSCGDLLLSYAEKSSLQFVLSQAYDALLKQKAPKAQADAIAWIDAAVLEFGIAGLAVRELIDYLKVGLKSTNANVRAAATKTLVTLKLFVGADIRTFVQDLNPALLTTIDVEFTRVDGQAPPAPTRQAADTQPSRAATGRAATGASAAGQPLDDLFPRVDLERLLPAGLASECNDANWKVRKEALERLQGILEANKRLKPADLTTPLKLRLADSNKIVQALALDIVGRLASGIGPAFDKHARGLCPAVIGVLSDQKASVRAAALATLSAIADAIALDSLVPAIATALETPNPAMRADLLSWTSTRAGAVEAVDLSALAGPLLSCLEDRSADVRKAAQAALVVIGARVGFSNLNDAAGSLKPASRATVLPLIASAERSSAPGAESARSSEPRAAAVLGKPALRMPLASSRQAPTAAPPARSAAPSAPAAAGQSARTARKIDPVEVVGVESPPLRTADSAPKQARATRESGVNSRWLIEGPAKPQQVDALRMQMVPQVSPELLGLLFSRDRNAERDHLSGLQTVEAFTQDADAARRYRLSPSEPTKRFVANVDLVFKYLTVHLFDASLVMVGKCLDVAQRSLEVLGRESYTLSDYEASILLPCFIAKSGDAQETIRRRITGLLRTLRNAYPASKIFGSLLDNGLTSANPRTRSESVRELADLLQRQGLSVCQPRRAFPALAALLSDRDPSVCSAALDALVIAHGIAGAELMQSIGPLPDQEMATLTARLDLPAATNGFASIRTSPRSRLPSSRPLSITSQSTTLATPVTSSLTPASLAAACEAALSPVPDDSVAALKTLTTFITSNSATVVAHVDAVVEAVAVQMRTAFDRLGPTTPSATMRLCRHLLHTLSTLFDERRLGQAVSRAALIHLLGELTRRLLETAEITTYEPVLNLSRALNMVLIRIFHNSARTACFGALLSILEAATRDMRELNGDELIVRSKYAELVMKCLWKVSKTAKDSLEDGSLDTRRLLADIDDFLVAVPPAEWRRRASDNMPLGDMPLRSVKTLLQQLVSVHGEAVSQYFDEPRLADSTVHAYVQRLLGPARSTVEAPVSTAPASPRSDGLAATDLPTSADDILINQRLKEIFDVIGDVETSKQGIRELYRYRRENPQAEARIQLWIGATGKAFRSYLQRTMKNLEAEERESGVPASAPASPSVRSDDRLAQLRSVFH